MSTQIQTTDKQNADVAYFELLQREANLLSSSSLVPVQYRSKIEKKEYGKVVGYEENPVGMANSFIAIDMAKRMNANSLMVMQNLSIIEGRPSWSSQWIIAMINACGKFTALRFEIQDLGEKEVEYITYEWEKQQTGKDKKVAKSQTVKIHDYSCIAYATEKETGQKLTSSPISIEMAVKEGWYTKNGSKWQTMEQIMLRYRSASFFGKIYAPELMMGLQSVEENTDIIDLSDKYPDATVVEPKKYESVLTPSPANNAPPPATEQETTTDPETGEITNVDDSEDEPLTPEEHKTKLKAEISHWATTKQMSEKNATTVKKMIDVNFSNVPLNILESWHEMLKDLPDLSA